MTKDANTAVIHAPPRIQYYLESFTVFFLAFIGGLALSRTLYEGLFPQLLILGRPYVALPFAVLIAFFIWTLWHKFTIHHSPFTIHHSPLTLSPLLLNLLWLLDPVVDLTRSRFIFAAGLWLTAVLITMSRSQVINRWKWLGILFVVAALLPVYFLTMSDSVGAADTFEFQVVTPKLGIVHPTGYPLYLLLGKLFTWLPFGSLAWRLNFASVVFALGAMSLLYIVLYRMLLRPLPAILAAAITGLTATFWSQAIIAEVYALQALIVATAVFLMAEIGDWRIELFHAKAQRRKEFSYLARLQKDQLIILLAFIIGLGMTNHVTTIFLILPAILTTLFAYYVLRNTDHRLPITDYRFYLKIGAVFLLPLLLYAYLPLRWQAVNGEPMGVVRFVDWVVAGRFQGAWQWRAWLDDPARYEIMRRLFIENWGWFNLVIAVLGFAILLWRNWRPALILLTLWFGYTFYSLNYYVPDLAVFIIPAQMVVGICWGVGVFVIFEIGDRRVEIGDYLLSNLQSLIATMIIIPTLLLAVAHWSDINQSGENELELWGRGVLALPLAENGAILADSEKIAPLNYLQVAEGLRPDLDISVWPDEAAYREQIDGRLAANQTVYLARQLPGLQSIYHLRSIGPLTEVSNTPIPQLPNPSISPSSNINFGPIRLIGYEVEPVAAIDETATAVTFYWQTSQPVAEPQYIYVKFDGWRANAGQHPANNFYPTNAWEPGEIVSDFHLLPQPILAQPETLSLQVALAPPFTNPDELDWQTVTQVELNTTGHRAGERPYRAQIGHTLLSSTDFPEQIRPQTPLPLLFSGFGNGSNLEFSLEDRNRLSVISDQSLTNNRLPATDSPFTLFTELPTPLENGRYYLIAQSSSSSAACGWMQPLMNGCILGEVEISGVVLPETAVNFADKIALLNIDIPNPELQPGGQLQLNINWLALANMAHDYTITVQVLDRNDRLVGQTDSWPLQGTRPTSQWQPGETISDPYVIQLDPQMPPGDYQLLVGIYLLADGRRLSVLNEAGTAVNDKLITSGLTVP